MFPGLRISKISTFRKTYHRFSNVHSWASLTFSLKGRNKSALSPLGYAELLAGDHLLPARAVGRNFGDFLARPFQRPGANDTAEGKGKNSESLSIEDRHSLSSPGSLVMFTLGKSLDGGPSSALLPLPSPVHLGQALPLLRADGPSSPPCLASTDSYIPHSKPFFPVYPKRP